MRELIECVPNISEGRRPEVVSAVVDALRAIPGVHLLDHSSDVSHNRSVLTMIGTAEALEGAVMKLYEVILPLVDLRHHSGEHPRIGAVDVVPFVPISHVTMADCVALAKQTASGIAERFDVPVFLYEEAATRPERRNLEDIRRGEFEGLAAKLGDLTWKPDYGPIAPHPSAGASVVGARMPLIAYNINLATDRLEIAKHIAATIRHSSGGFRFVKAMGVRLDDRHIVQVSMNLTNYEKTSIFRVFEVVKREAERFGVAILESEIVGLIPSAALTKTAEFYLQLNSFKDDQILEHRVAGASAE